MCMNVILHTVVDLGIVHCLSINGDGGFHSIVYLCLCSYNAKQKHLGYKKVRGQSEAALHKGGQVTKPIIVAKICYKLLYMSFK